MIKNQVRLFKKRSAEFGDPSKLLLLAKLVIPVLLGIRKRINKIKIILNINQIIFNINFLLDENN